MSRRYLKDKLTYQIQETVLILHFIVSVMPYRVLSSPVQDTVQDHILHAVVMYLQSPLTWNSFLVCLSLSWHWHFEDCRIFFSLVLSISSDQIQLMHCCPNTVFTYYISYFSSIHPSLVMLILITWSRCYPFPSLCNYYFPPCKLISNL